VVVVCRGLGWVGGEGWWIVDMSWTRVCMHTPSFSRQYMCLSRNYPLLVHPVYTQAYGLLYAALYMQFCVVSLFSLWCS
jgi:hypothetical protein